MAPAQTIEARDLPPEILRGARGERPAPSGTETAAAGVPAAPAEPASGGAPAAPDEVRGTPEAPAAPAPPEATWLDGLERELNRLLLADQSGAWETLTRQFEARLILTALGHTRGRRIEAAHKLGIGRNTITRKIQELGLDRE